MDKNTASYRRMDKVILNAFIELTAQMPFESITVQKIADTALISRYTFYAHFHDKYEVAERIQDDLYQEFIRLILQEIPAINAATPNRQQVMDVAILEFYQKHAARTQSIINIHTETIDFSGRIKTFLAENYKSRFPDHENLDLESKLYANMAMTLSEYYISNTNSLLNNKSRISSYIYTFLYAIGIHDESLIQKEYNRFMKMKYSDENIC